MAWLGLALKCQWKCGAKYDLILLEWVTVNAISVTILSQSIAA